MELEKIKINCKSARELSSCIYYNNHKYWICHIFRKNNILTHEKSFYSYHLIFETFINECGDLYKELQDMELKNGSLYLIINKKGVN